MENVNRFLEELSELTTKYGIIIAGCGCCGSPYLTNISGETSIEGKEMEDLAWDIDHYELNTIYDSPADETSNYKFMKGE